MSKHDETGGTQPARWWLGGGGRGFASSHTFMSCTTSVSPARGFVGASRPLTERVWLTYIATATACALSDYLPPRQPMAQADQITLATSPKRRAQSHFRVRGRYSHWGAVEGSSATLAGCDGLCKQSETAPDIL